MKYNLSAIMKRAWEIKKSWSARALTFAQCLKNAWAEAKQAVQEAAFYNVAFENGMTVIADGHERTLNRWTKGEYDRVYINGGQIKKGDGYVDLKKGIARLNGDLYYQRIIAKMILSMTF